MVDEKQRMRQHMWYLRNREKVIQRSKLWKLNNPERTRELECEHARRYREKYPERCREANRRRWREQIEQYRARSLQWYYEHRDKARSQNKKWKERNKEHVREHWKEYYDENREKLLETHRLYLQENGAKLREKDRARRRTMGMAEWGSKEHLRKWFVSNQIKPNKPEEQLIKLFKDHSLPYKFVGDGQVVLGGKCPDFINYNGEKQIIELFGDYWHEPEEEEERKRVFAQFGYETLIIWEHELEHEDVLLSKIHGWDRNGFTLEL